MHPFHTEQLSAIFSRHTGHCPEIYNEITNDLLHPAKPGDVLWRLINDKSRKAIRLYFRLRAQEQGLRHEVLAHIEAEEPAELSSEGTSRVLMKDLLAHDYLLFTLQKPKPLVLTFNNCLTIASEKDKQVDEEPLAANEDYSVIYYVRNTAVNAMFLHRDMFVKVRIRTLIE